MYTKARSEFGKQVRFDNERTELINELPADYDKKEKENNIIINPSQFSIDTHPQMSISTVNTERLMMSSTPMLHKEGGWPRDIDCNEKVCLLLYTHLYIYYTISISYI